MTSLPMPLTSWPGPRAHCPPPEPPARPCSAPPSPPFPQGNSLSPPTCWWFGQTPHCKSLHSPAGPLTPSQTRVTPRGFPPAAWCPGILGPAAPSSALSLPAQTIMGGQGAPVPPQAVPGLHRTDPPQTRSSLTPRSPPPSDG